VEDYLGLIILAVVAHWFGQAALCAWLSEQKGRWLPLWFVLGLIFPVVAMLALIGAPEQRLPFDEDNSS